MPTELEELVEFLHHGNTQIRQTAAEHLVGYSKAEPSLFKRNQLEPIKDLKLLVKDYEPIAKDAITILINLSGDAAILKELDTDNAFLESLLFRITGANESNADLLTMLLANMAKSDALKRILTLKRPVPSDLSTSGGAMDQLMDTFVKGAEGTYNSKADFDYLAYFFADVAKYSDGQKYFVTSQDYDGVVPFTKLIVFTENGSLVRRKGVASTIKNVAFHVDSHQLLLSKESVDLLPYILLPLAGPEELSDEDTEKLLPELQLLPSDKKRDSDKEILKTHLESLLLLTTTRRGREVLRTSGVYPIVREVHLHVDDEGVREAAERLVDVLMRDEHPAGDEAAEIEDDEDNKVEEIF